MECRPILSAMRRNKAGALLIALQMAITLAVLCNGLFIIEQRLSFSQRPTGADESHIFFIQNQWVANPPDLSARLQTDLAALRALPGVIDAFASNSHPLGHSGYPQDIKLSPDQKSRTAQAAVYFADEHGLQTLGLKLIAGRNFSGAEVIDKASWSAQVLPPAIIITRTLADKLFPGKEPLGRSIYLQPDNRAVQIIGIVDRLQVPWAQAWASKFNDNSIIEPFRLLSFYSFYIVRVQPGQVTAVLRAAENRLIEIDPLRILGKSQSLTAARAEVYRDDRGLAVILAVVCIALVGISAFGIIGLTSYWVAQRRRQIGIRRALGATRHNIVRYFQTENFLIVAAGAGAGATIAVFLNLWMATFFEMPRLPVSYVVISIICVFFLGQIAAFWPALKAATISPVEATRG